MKKQNKHLLTVAACGLCLGATPVITLAQDASPSMASASDRKFVSKAAEGGMAEVKMGQLAADKGSSPDVKSFGQQMVDDHTKANDELKATATKEGMTLPNKVGPKEQAMYNRLSKMSGPAFDKAYVKSMVMDHQEDVRDFQKEATSGKDDQIKSFASRTLPTLQGHLDKIKTIQAGMGTGSGKMSGMAKP